MTSGIRRILILGLNYAPERTGNAPYTTSLARALAARGSRVRVLTSFAHYPEWRLSGDTPWQKRESIDGVHVHRLRHYVPSRPRGIARLLSEVSFGLRLLFANWGRPDVIIFVSPALIASGMAMARATLFHRRARRFTWVQDLYGKGLSETGEAGRRLAAVMVKFEREVFRTSHRVVVIHPLFERYLRDELGMPSHKVSLVRNWTHLREVSTADREVMRERLGWLSDEFVVLHAGNMGVKQGLENVVETARLADGSPARLRFVLLGGGSRLQQLRAISEGVNSLQFLESMSDEDFQATLRAADLLLVNEKAGVAGMAVPSKLTSYFDAARPVIAATDSEGATALELRESGAGVAVSADDPRALLEAIVELAGDPQRLEEMGLNGRRFRETQLGERMAVDRYARLLGLHEKSADA
ncbi:glycosyltransferase family 4 protein [Cnuibacter physcomitrellae]|uniref:glycosyltransferase family 4 protein n=1 Tax=Cnuibacter physcomitrellae TaxID=1619308 RepID=UPI0021758402|nr:glycosyltransferase family 4 protein [Cnuibacter physcomitrellae]MCS5496119.1 glycosyltransferase family 4 protein [Cnuibacter physcomitrellae]